MARLVLDGLYLVAAIVLAPLLLARLIRRKRPLRDPRSRLGWVCDLPRTARPRLLIHAVSVGEVNTIRLLLEHLERHPARPEVVLATTTETGQARARAIAGDRHAVVRYPLDFSRAVRRFLARVRPDAVVLVELEVWPNFTSVCAARGIPVCVINGRLTERSLRRYRRVLPIVRPMFRRLAFVAAQTEAYAARFASLGARPGTIHVTDTMKWDAAQLRQDEAAAQRMREEMGIDPRRPLIVAGSTAPGEHALLHEAVRDSAQLLCAPRRPEWFDQAAAAFGECARRSRRDRGSRSGRFLLDTLGELSCAYALADLVVIGRTFDPLHGSDMMEPAALGKPIIVGPSVSNFADTVDALQAADGIVQTTAADLAHVIAGLLADERRRAELAANARATVLRHQGATERHLHMVMELLGRRHEGTEARRHEGAE